MPNKLQTIRILHVVGGLGMGGIEQLLTSVYQHIHTDRIQFDFAVHNSTPQYFAPLVEKLGGKIHVVPIPNKIGLRAYMRWWKNFYKQHPEYQIVHGHMPTYAFIYLGIAKYYKRVTIMHSHSVVAHEPFPRNLVIPVLHYPLRWISDYFFACSQAAGEYLFGKRAVKKSKFYVVANARDIHSFAYNPNTRAALRKELGITENFVLGHVGRLIGPKNHPFLLRVFAYIYKQNPQARLLLVGDGPLQQPLKQLAAQLHLENAIIWAGNVANPADYYQAMDVFVFPSKYEGLGMALIEAQIAGLPCVLSAHLPPEVDLEEGLCHRLALTQPADEWAAKILELKNTPRVSREQAACAKGFEISSLTKKLEDFYAQLLQCNWGDNL